MAHDYEQALAVALEAALIAGAGALLGAVHGREAVPRQWRTMLLSCRPVQGLSVTSHPRPAPFWPVDALELAERLAGITLWER